MKLHHIPDHIIFKHINPVAPINLAHAVPVRPVGRGLAFLNAATTPELGLITFTDALLEARYAPFVIYIAAAVIRHVAVFVFDHTEANSDVHACALRIVNEIKEYDQERERDEHPETVKV